MANKGPQPGWIKLIAGLYLLEFVVIFLIVFVLGVLGIYSSTIEILAIVLLVILFVMFFGIWKGIKPFWYLAVIGAVVTLLSFGIIQIIVGVAIMYGLFRSDVKDWFNIKYSISSQTKPAKFIAMVLVLIIIGIVVMLISAKGVSTPTSPLYSSTSVSTSTPYSSTSTSIPSSNSLTAYCISQQSGYTCKSLSLNTQSLSAVVGFPYSSYGYNNVSFGEAIHNNNYSVNYGDLCTSPTTNFGNGGNFTVTCPVSQFGIIKGEHYQGHILMTYKNSFGVNQAANWNYTVNAT